MTQQQESAGASRSEETIKYFVNGEEIVHVFQKPPDREVFQLTVRDILESAGFSPAEDYELTRDAKNETFGSPDDEVQITNGERFTAVYKGPTPTS